jgi:hypothetical protein
LSKNSFPVDDSPPAIGRRARPISPGIIHTRPRIEHDGSPTIGSPAHFA